MYWFWIRIQNFGPIWIHKFGLIWIQIRIQGYVINFERNILNNFRIFSQLSLLIVNLCLKSYTFCLYFILYLHVWIRIYTKLLNTDPNLIRIHNTGYKLSGYWPERRGLARASGFVPGSCSPVAGCAGPWNPPGKKSCFTVQVWRMFTTTVKKEMKSSGYSEILHEICSLW